MECKEPGLISFARPLFSATQRSAWHPSLVRILSLGFGVLMLVLLTGCGAQPTSASAGASVRAATATPLPTATAEPTIAPAQLERARTLLVTQGCTGCHTIASFPEAQGLVGPDLSHIASEAPQIIVSADYKNSTGTATTAQAFLRESILEPSRFVAPTCPFGACTDNLMPKDFQTRLKEDEITALVDLLLSLK